MNCLSSIIFFNSFFFENAEKKLTLFGMALPRRTRRSAKVYNHGGLQG